MIGRLWHGLVLLGVMALMLGGCDLPVRIGIKEAQAAGVAVDATPGHQNLWQPRATPAQTQAHAGNEVLFLPKVPKATAPNDVVGVKIQQTGDLGRRQITFGQIFEDGMLPSGRRVVARTTAGARLPTQLDIKTTNPDGSARMGIVTVAVDGPVDVMLERSDPDQAAPPVNLAGLNGRYRLTVDLTIENSGGTDRHHFDIDALLAQALRAGQVSYWLRGPLVTEGRISVPVVGSMRLVADIRAYSDGSVMTDLQFNNDIAMQPVGGALTYDVAIRSDGETIFERTGVRHFQYQTWHLEVWNRGPPPVNVVHDIASMARAGAIQNYDLSTGVAFGWLRRQVAGMSAPAFDILGSAGIAKTMGMTGLRPDIGPLTAPNTIWLMTQHPDAARYALAQADGAGSIPWHFFDADAQTYATSFKYPKLWSDGRGGKSGTQALTQQVDYAGTGWSPDTAHQPELSYTAYILTGSRYRYDQLEAQAAACVIMQWPASRQDDKALVASNMQQVRGRAWALREIDNVAFIAPDDSRLRPYFEQVLRNNIDFLLSESKTRRQGEAYGWVNDPSNGIAPWMQDFLGTTLVLSATRKVRGAREVLDWMSNYLVGRFTAGDKGYRPNNAVAFHMNMYAKDPMAPYLTWREVEADTIKHSFAKDSSDWCCNDRNLGRIALATLAGIVTVTQSPKAQQAYVWLLANGPGFTLQDRRNNPTWNIIPMPEGHAR